MFARSTWHSRQRSVDCVERSSAGLDKLYDISVSVIQNHCDVCFETDFTAAVIIMIHLLHQKVAKKIANIKHTQSTIHQ